MSQETDELKDATLRVKQALMGLALRAGFNAAMIKRRVLFHWHYFGLTPGQKEAVKEHARHKAEEFAELQRNMAQANARNATEGDEYRALRRKMREPAQEQHRLERWAIEMGCPRGSSESIEELRQRIMERFRQGPGEMSGPG